MTQLSCILLGGAFNVGPEGISKAEEKLVRIFLGCFKNQAWNIPFHNS